MALNSENHDDERLVIDLNVEPASQDTDMDEPTDGPTPKTNNNSIHTTTNYFQQDGYGHLKRKRKTWRQGDVDQEYIERLIQRVKEVTENQPINEDQDRMFLLSLLPFMKRLNARENLQFRQEVQEILLKKIENENPRLD